MVQRLGRQDVYTYTSGKGWIKRTQKLNILFHTKMEQPKEYTDLAAKFRNIYIFNVLRLNIIDIQDLHFNQ